MYIGNDLQVAESGNKIIDDISSSFNGSTTSFALTVGGYAPVPFPINTQQIYISVNGVLQEPDPSGSAGFKLSGSNIVFSSAPANGHAFFGVILSGADYVTVGTEFPAGSATSPSITFGTDSDTGMYSVTSGTMGFTSNGVQIFTLDGDAFRFNDNKKLLCGTGTDLQIYHDGTDSFIDNATGGLKIVGDTIRLKGKTADETLLKAIVNGDVELYYNNTERFATTNTGTNTVGVHVDDGATHDGDVTFTGASANVIWDKSADDLIFTDNSKAVFGTSSDGLEIFHNGSNSLINEQGTGTLQLQIGGTSYVTLDGSGRLLLGTTSSRTVNSASSSLQLEGTSGHNSSFTLVRNQAASGGPALQFGKTRNASVGGNTIVQDDDQLGCLIFVGNDGTDLECQGARIDAHVDGTPGSNDMPGRLTFSTTADGASSTTERMRISSDGKIGIGTAIPEDLLHIKTGKIRIENAIVSNNDSTISYDNTDFLIDVDPNNVRGSSQFQIKVDTVAGLTIDANRNVGIGVTAASPDYPLHVANDTEANLCIETNNNSATNFAGLRMRKSRGTHASPTVVSNGDVIAQIFGYGYDGDQYHQAAKMVFEVDGTPGDNDMPGRIIFQTSADGGTTPVERLRITNAGAVQLNSDGGNTYFSVGASQDFKVYHDAGGPTIFSDGGNQGLKVSIKDLNLTEYTGNTTRVKIDNTGRVGINRTTWPDSACPLVIYNGQANSEHTLVDIVSDPNESCRILFSETDDSGKGLIKYAHGTSGDSMHFHTLGDEHMRITAQGGIGMTGGINTEFADMVPNKRSMPKFFESTSTSNNELNAADVWFEHVGLSTTHPDYDLFDFTGSYNFGVWIEVTAFFSQITASTYGREDCWFRAQRNGDANFSTSVSGPYNEVGSGTDHWTPSFTSSGSGSSQRLTVRMTPASLTNYCKILFRARIIGGDTIKSMNFHS